LAASALRTAKFILHIGEQIADWLRSGG